MSDAHTRILFSLYSYNFVSTDIYHDVFSEIFSQRIEVFPKEIVFDQAFISEDEFSLITKWLLVAIAKYIAGTDEALLARLYRNIQSITPTKAGMLGNPRVNTLAVTAFIEMIYPVKYAIFSVNEGLQDLRLSNFMLFEDYFKETDSSVM